MFQTFNYLAPLNTETNVRNVVELKANLSAKRSGGMYIDPDEAMDNIKLGTKACMISLAYCLRNLKRTFKTDAFTKAAYSSLLKIFFVLIEVSCDSKIQSESCDSSSLMETMEASSSNVSEPKQLSPLSFFSVPVPLPVNSSSSWFSFSSSSSTSS